MTPDDFIARNTASTFAERLAAKVESGWWGEEACPVLRPFGFLYGLGASLRRHLYGSLIRPQRAARPVISIGNLTVGGSGKTPMCLTLAGELLRRGYKPSVLSRGYGRRVRDDVLLPLVVSRGQGPLTAPADSGDEPWLLASQLYGLRVVVDHQRIRGAEVAKDLGADVLILDDGFQHLAIEADCRILLIPAHNSFGNGRVMPAGPLREPISAHRAAHILVSTGAENPSDEIRSLAGNRPVFGAVYQPVGWRVFGKDKCETIEALAGCRVFAFCGLGRPDGFMRSLNELRLDVKRFVALHDHQHYDRRLSDELQSSFRSSGAEVMVTTAKDAVKIPPDFPGPLLILQIELAVPQVDMFLNAVLGLIGHKKVA